MPSFAPPIAAAADPVVYAAGDIACAPGSSQTSTTCHERQTSDIILGSGAARALVLGDIQYDSATLSNLQGSYNNTWGRIKSITSPVLGNHETSGSGYFDYFYGSGVNSGPFGARGKGWYSLNVGAWHLIGLNSNCSRVACTAGSEQEQWLRADMAANPTTCTLAYWHHPRWSSGHDGNGTFMQPIWQALYDGNVDLALVGHSHHYERFRPAERKWRPRQHERDPRVHHRHRRRVLHRRQQPDRQQPGAPEQHLRRPQADASPNQLRLAVHARGWARRSPIPGTQACHGSGGTPPPPADTQAPSRAREPDGHRAGRDAGEPLLGGVERQRRRDAATRSTATARS